MIFFNKLPNDEKHKTKLFCLPPVIDFNNNKQKKFDSVNGIRKVFPPDLSFASQQFI